jgi:hypothetical protein
MAQVRGDDQGRTLGGPLARVLAGVLDLRGGEVFG